MNAIRRKDGYFFRLSEFVYDENGNEYRWDEVDLVTEVNNDDMSHVRNLAATKAMDTLITIEYTDKEQHKRTVEKMVEQKVSLAAIIAKDAVIFADALCDELVKNKKIYTK